MKTFTLDHETTAIHTKASITILVTISSACIKMFKSLNRIEKLLAISCKCLSNVFVM